MKALVLPLIPWLHLQKPVHRFSALKRFFTANLWLPIGLATLLLKMPLLLLPGAGRDEAVYYYWSRHPEWFYAPLLQLALRVFDFFPLPHMLMLRLPSLLSGFLILWLLDKIFRARGLPSRQRAFALAVIGFLPWQIYTGAILHPDNGLLVSMLLFLFFYRMGADALAAASAGLAVLAKPVGVLVLVVSWGLFIRAYRGQLKRVLPYLALSLLVASPVLMTIRPELIQAIAEFGHIPGNVSLLTRLCIGLVSILTLGGLLLPMAAWQGLREHLQARIAAGGLSRDRMASLMLGGAFLLVFIIALVVHGQIKGNWFLPGFVLLWPVPGVRLQRVGRRSLFVVQLAMSAMFSLVISHPQQVQRLEGRSVELAKWYMLQAGTRDARVASIHSWSQRLCEYQDMHVFALQILQIWHAQDQGDAPPAWIVSDDYGLAAQLAYQWNKAGPRIVVPCDGLFIRSMPGKEISKMRGGVLILAMHHDLDHVWGRLRQVKALGKVVYPVTGEVACVGRCNGDLRQSKTGNPMSRAPLSAPN